MSFCLTSLWISVEPPWTSVVNPIKKYLEPLIPYKENQAIIVAKDTKHNKYHEAGLDSTKYNFVPHIC